MVEMPKSRPDEVNERVATEHEVTRSWSVKFSELEPGRLQLMARRNDMNQRASQPSEYKHGDSVLYCKLGFEKK